MYENLLRLPYFQGMSKDDITAILDKVAFEFRNYSEGETICEQGETCDKFVILTQGTLNSSIDAPNEEYTVIEECQAPLAIEPYSLFGQDTTFKRSYTANSKCTTLVIDKQYLFTEFTKYQVFTINFLNLISRRAQMQSHAIWNYTPRSIKGRIVQFIGMRCNSIEGRKTVQIKMEQLADILCETRLNISKALNEMQDDGYIELHRKEIAVPSLKRMIEEINP